MVEFTLGQELQVCVHKIIQGTLSTSDLEPVCLEGLLHAKQTEGGDPT